MSGKSDLQKFLHHAGMRPRLRGRPDIPNGQPDSRANAC